MPPHEQLDEILSDSLERIEEKIARHLNETTAMYTKIVAEVRSEYLILKHDILHPEEAPQRVVSLTELHARNIDITGGQPSEDYIRELRGGD